MEVDGTLALIGPSGAGKSTLLRLIAGLLKPQEGLVECNGDVWYGHGVNMPPERRRVGFVFQDYALFPHLSVHRNVAFEARRDVGTLLDQLGIAHLADAKPRRLSGGERQRVALARALATDPGALLLDEPLAALDPATRGTVADELAGILHTAAVPALVVTHSYEEAVMLADRVAVIDHGTIVQQGSAADLLESPATSFVADFAGVNYLPGTAHGTTVRLDRGGSITTTRPEDGPVAVLIAPWDITLSLTEPDIDAESAINHLRTRVRRVIVLGNRARIVLGDLTAEITPESVRRLDLRTGTDVVAVWKASATRLVKRRADQSRG